VGESVELAAGDRLGRYTLVAELGRGAMGLVWRAHDPALARDVALKIMRSELLRDPESRARMLREAQALACLSDPNVVAVFDVGEARLSSAGPIVYIAMELVAGRSLREHILAGAPMRPLPWLLAAGRGLLAAHRAGIIHRDFKPANILIDSPSGLPDGTRVLVADFGLARGSIDSESADSMPAPHELSSTLTRRGTVMGTPLYMAPEQHLAARASIASDQYAFCATAFELLVGRPPFIGADLDALLEAKLGEPPTIPRDAAPSHVRAAILRGLDPDPTRRWRDMDQLLRALAGGRRRNVALALGGAAIAGLAVAIAATAPRGDRCEATSWDLHEVRDAIVSSELPYAAAVADRVSAELDGYATQWSAQRADACRSANEGELVQARIACLERARSSLRASISTLSTADRGTIERAVAIVEALPALDDCDRATAIDLPADEPERERIAAVRERLADATALHRAARDAEAEPIVRALDEEIAALDRPGLAAEHALLSGLVAIGLGNAAEAEAELERAHHLATMAGDDVLVARACAELTMHVGSVLGRLDDAMTWARHGEAAVARLGDPLADARQAAALGSLLRIEGRFAEARERQAHALALREQVLGPDNLDVAASLHNLANVRYEEDALSEARALYERALAIRVTLLGEAHPLVGMTYGGLVAIDFRAGDAQQAERDARRAVAILEPALGPDHIELSMAVHNLGIALYSLGRRADARAAFERAAQIQERALGPDHPDVALALVNVAAMAYESGDYTGALATDQRALALLEAAFGRDNLECAIALNGLGNALSALERWDEARAAYQRGLDIVVAHRGVDHGDTGPYLLGLAGIAGQQQRWEDALALDRRALAVLERTFGPDHPRLLRALVNVGMSSNMLGRHADAIAPLQRAIAIAEAASDKHPIAADARAELAEAYLGLGRTTEAHALAEQALADAARADEDNPRTLAKMRSVVARASARRVGDRREPHALGR
jgi:eukaryotic-like serine/threonine-protein kinase